MSAEAWQRGLVMLQRGRPAEAEPFFRESLGADPHQPHVLYYLALVLNAQGGRERNKEALDVVVTALALTAEDPDLHALRAEILIDLDRPGEADAAAREAVRLAPEDPGAWTVTGLVLLSLERWPAAEEAARKALSFDTHNARANQVLLHALRMQGKREEDEALTGMMLAANPESDHTQANAGWSKLRHGSPADAETHFLEALRINPENDYAREGMKQAFRSRSRLYHAYLRFGFFLASLPQGASFGIMLGLYFGYRLTSRFLHSVGADLLAMGFAMLYLAFVGWSYWSPALGNMLLWRDRRARHALTRAEKFSTGGVGVLLLVSLLCFAGVALGPVALPWVMAGFVFISATFPFCLAFPNRSLPGRILFSLVALHAVAVGGMVLMEALEPGLWFEPGFLRDRMSQNGIAIFISTLLSWTPSLRR